MRYILQNCHHILLLKPIKGVLMKVYTRVYQNKALPVRSLPYTRERVSIKGNRKLTSTEGCFRQINDNIIQQHEE